jgi:hypothetical protein
MNFSPLKGLVYDVQKHNALMDYLDVLINMESSRLEGIVEPHLIYRSQGKISALREMKNLRKNVIAAGGVNG